MAFLEIPRFYNFKANIITFNGLEITGFGDDGGVEYEMGDDIHRDASTADGETIVSRVNDARLYATFTVMETSRGYRILSELLREQLSVETAIPPLPYIHIDPINGDVVRSSHAVFMQHPSPSKARDEGTREFRILLPYAAYSMELGIAIL